VSGAVKRMTPTTVKRTTDFVIVAKNAKLKLKQQASSNGREITFVVFFHKKAAKVITAKY
jgi:hypothetical protein